MLIPELSVDFFLGIFCEFNCIISCAGEGGKRRASGQGVKKGNSVCPFLMPFPPNSFTLDIA